MFFADAGNKDTERHPPCIKRATMDGMNQFVVVKENLISPSNLAIDRVNQRIFWADKNTDRVETCDYNGQHRYV